MTEFSRKSETASDYDEWAETYDSVVNRTRDLAGEILKKFDFNLRGLTVLEIGCGTGRNTTWLARPEAGAAEIVALDFSEGMLGRARERVRDSRVRFVQHDIRAPWPVPSGFADVVIVMLVLEHVENLQPVFFEGARVLRPAGEFLICELHPERQLMGKQAEFASKQTGKLKRVEAFLHLVQDYLTAGKLAGLELVKLAEWHDEDAPTPPPRLLSVHFRRRRD